MPKIEDKQAILSRLEKNRIWTAYAIADLDPPYSENAAWFLDEDNDALTLIYQGFDQPIVFCCENSAPSPSMLGEIDLILCRQKRCIITRAESSGWIRTCTSVLNERAFIRMHLRPENFRPSSDETAIRLSSAHLALIKELFGASTPEFFLDSMLDEGVYYGIIENGQMMAVAGTHVLSIDHKIGALGNIFTRPDKRNRGYSSRATSAVSRHLLNAGVETIVLNVIEGNDAAMKVYKRLGFEINCRFLEMLVVPD